MNAHILGPPGSTPAPGQPSPSATCGGHGSAAARAGDRVGAPSTHVGQDRHRHRGVSPIKENTLTPTQYLSRRRLMGAAL
ncbi:hypothetical protein Q7689_33545, partial [Nocardiopsis tropica]|nr:hypothetical protein [Nocardiopsis tropica]